MFVSPAYLAAAPDAERQAFLKNHLKLGYQPETYDDFYVHTLDRYSGVYIEGKPGMGKSGLLQNMVLQDAQDKAVIVLDPHMDLIDKIIACLPSTRMPDTYILDMTDEKYPFGINLFNITSFTSDMEKTQAVARIEHVFETLWEDVLKQVGLPRFMRMATHVLLDNPGTTLVDMYDFLTHDPYRRQLLAAVKDVRIRDWWQLNYDSLAPQTRINKVQPLLGRLEQLFVGRELVSNIVGQKQNTIDFRKAIEQKQNIFIKVPLKLIPEDARLIAMLLVAQLHATLFSFVNLPEGKRPTFCLYLDEFQNFVTDDIKEMITEGRKYGIQIVLAHQYRGQLSKDMREATMNAQTKVVFQSTPEDGREFAHLFPAPNDGVKPENVDPHPTETLANHVHLYPPEVQDFTEWYVLPVGLQAVGAHGNMIELRDLGVGAMDIALGMMSGGRLHELKVENPLVYLDYLLQMVMVYGDASLPIPALAVRGFANCGHSFWQQVRDIRDDDKRLLAAIPDLPIPKHLAMQTPDGWVWTRYPESGKEQLLHLLFHLRLVMQYLAAHPLGKETVATTADVGKMLNQLPRRCAWVRSGTKTGTIITHDTPPPNLTIFDSHIQVSHDALNDRMTFVRDSTRMVYCHPKAEVEQHKNRTAESRDKAVAANPIIPDDQPTDPKLPAMKAPPLLSGWEEAE